MGLRRILVPFEGGPLSEDALEVACGLTEAEVTALHVLATPSRLPIGAEEVAVARAEEIGRELNARVATQVVKAVEVADGVVETAAAIGADAIVMSLRHKHAPGETPVLSHTVSRVLRRAPCRVIITYTRES